MPKSAKQAPAPGLKKGGLKNRALKKQSLSKWPQKAIIYTDGASRGNPGRSAFGLQAFNEKKELIYEEGRLLPGLSTNNEAEYEGALRALGLAFEKKVRQLTLCSDSQLLIRQLRGQYKVKAAGLKPLFRRCQAFLCKIPSCRLIHIPREQNKGADRMANQALDKGYDILQS